MKPKFNLSKKRRKLREDMSYFFKKIDWKHSFLDAKAIQIMNEFMKDILDADKEFIRSLKKELVSDIDDEVTQCIHDTIDKLAGEKFK